MANGSLINSQVGEYRLVDFLGAGGMGEVYRAVHLKIGRVVAVKVLTRAEKHPSLLERFLNEARIQASLHHPNIATLYDFQEVNGNHCIIMECVDGQNLDERLKSLGCLPLSEAVFVIQAVVEALSYMHANGVIHRDIKTNNIKISSAGQVKLLDFGIAKAGATPNLTAAGDVVGTLAYLSPEQFKGGTADTRSDVWALGILLYELVTGHVPFEATTIGGLYEMITKGDYSAPRNYNPGLPPEVETIIARCLKKNPADRYQSAQALRGDVMNLTRLVSTPRLSSANVERPSDQRYDPPARPGHGKALIAMAVGAVAVIVLLIYLAVVYMSPPEPNEPLSSNTVIPKTSPGGLTSPSPAASGDMKTVHIDVREGHAEVYVNDQPMGQTPLEYHARVGEQLKLVLKQPGYKDKVVPLTVDPTADSKLYTIPMDKSQ
jgi:serine/threonine protein kinase